MPDWSYHTLLKPVLFRFPSAVAQRFALRVLSWLGQVPGGVRLVDFLGHMQPDRRLRWHWGGAIWPGPVGLDALVDPRGVARRALERFGCGFVVVGPVGETAIAGGGWHREAGGLVSHEPETVVTLAEAVSGLERGSEVPVIVRLAALDSKASGRIAEVLASKARALVVPVDREDDLARVSAVLDVAGELPVLVGMPGDRDGLVDLARSAVAIGAAGVWVSGGVLREDGGRGFFPGHAPVKAVAALRQTLGGEVLVAAGGVFEPADARDLLAAGAQWVAVEAGLVIGGPGLLKRTNEALLAARYPRRVAGVPGIEAARHAWFWGWLLGLAMLGGGILAAVFAATRVVLPYDEALCGINRAQFERINPRLLAFMAHDRMTLAGVMLALGWFYASLAWHALRWGAHWAKAAVVVSGISGYFSFFLFLGFGYFDPFHAFVTASLLPLALLCLATPMGVRYVPPVAGWRVDAAWHRGQWGQWLFVIVGMGLVGAGLVICGVGCTQVFVATDLDFLRTSVVQLQRANDRLLPLVAHDRASLGGMLISSGLVVWLTAQWGFRAGERWLWQALAVSGNLAFFLAIGVHLTVGYHSAEHLVPAFVGWGLWWLALGLSHGWLTQSGKDGARR